MELTLEHVNSKTPASTVAPAVLSAPSVTTTLPTHSSPPYRAIVVHKPTKALTKMKKDILMLLTRKA